MSYTESFTVNSDKVAVSDEHITARYRYTQTRVRQEGDQVVVEPTVRDYVFRTERAVPRLGVMLVGMGGNNGSTVIGGVLANKHGISWDTKNGIQFPNYFGSISQASTVKIGTDEFGEDFYVKLGKLIPTVDPNDLVFGGWDISDSDLSVALERSAVFDYDLQRQLRPYMKEFKPLPSIYNPDFVASNQRSRATNVIAGDCKAQLAQIRQDIRDFKAINDVEKVIILWTANTERFCEISEGVNDTKESLLASIEEGAEAEISPSTIFAVASILEDCPYINGSPQNTFTPGVIELAEERNVFIGGDDFKTGQTKMKSVMVDWLISAGIKPVSIVSYNHLGNNDGKNLSAPKQFRSKEISKSNVVDDMVASNPILYTEPGEHPDHVVVIKYVPYVGDSKRAMDEYTSKIFMNGHNTIVMHNTCEDSLLAAPIILDLIILTELITRIQYKTLDADGNEEQDSFQGLHPILSCLSYLLKAPLVPQHAPVVNALFKQKACIVNLFKACVGLPPDDDLGLEFIAPPPSAASDGAGAAGAP